MVYIRDVRLNNENKSSYISANTFRYSAYNICSKYIKGIQNHCINIIPFIANNTSKHGIFCSKGEILKKDNVNLVFAPLLMSWNEAKEKGIRDDDDVNQLVNMQWVIPLLAIMTIVHDSRIISFYFDFQYWLASAIVFFSFVSGSTSYYSHNTIKIILSICFSTVVPLAISKSMQGIVTLGKILRIKDDDFVIRMSIGVAILISKATSFIVNLIIFVFDSCLKRIPLSIQHRSYTAELRTIFITLKRYTIRTLFKVYDMLSMRKHDSKVFPIDYDEHLIDNSITLSATKHNVMPSKSPPVITAVYATPQELPAVIIHRRPPPVITINTTKRGLSATLGRLTVNCIRGIDLKAGRSLFGADPYAILRVGSEEFTTKPSPGGGKNPEWNEKFVFDISDEYEMEVDVMDKEMVDSDRYMGTCKVSIAKWMIDGHFEGALELVNRFGKPAGRVLIVATFIGQDSTTSSLSRQHIVTAKTQILQKLQPDEEEAARLKEIAEAESGANEPTQLEAIEGNEAARLKAIEDVEAARLEALQDAEARLMALAARVKPKALTKGSRDTLVEDVSRLKTEAEAEAKTLAAEEADRLNALVEADRMKALAEAEEAARVEALTLAAAEEAAARVKELRKAKEEEEEARSKRKEKVREEARLKVLASRVKAKCP